MTDPAAVLRRHDTVPAIPVEGARGASIQVLLGPDEGAPHFITRVFTLEPGGYIPSHRHPTIEHEQLMLEGEMTLGLDRDTVTLGPGDALLIPAGVSHWYANRGEQTVRFVCVIPRTDGYETEWLESL